MGVGAQGDTVQRLSDGIVHLPSKAGALLSRSRSSPRFGELVRTYATVRRTVSGALELAHTAAGWADAALYVDTKPWDVAAGVHLLRAAGGTWTGFAGPAADAAGTPGPGSPAPRPLAASAHTAPFALALAPGRAAPTAERVLHDIIETRITCGP